MRAAEADLTALAEGEAGIASRRDVPECRVSVSFRTRCGATWSAGRASRSASWRPATTTTYSISSLAASSISRSGTRRRRSGLRARPRTLGSVRSPRSGPVRGRAERPPGAATGARRPAVDRLSPPRRRRRRHSCARAASSRRSSSAPTRAAPFRASSARGSATRSCRCSASTKFPAWTVLRGRRRAAAGDHDCVACRPRADSGRTRLRRDRDGDRSRDRLGLRWARWANGGGGGREAAHGRRQPAPVHQVGTALRRLAPGGDRRDGRPHGPALGSQPLRRLLRGARARRACRRARPPHVGRRSDRGGASAAVVEQSRSRRGPGLRGHELDARRRARRHAGSRSPTSRRASEAATWRCPRSGTGSRSTRSRRRCSRRTSAPPQRCATKASPARSTSSAT